MALNGKNTRMHFLNPQIQWEIPEKCTEIPRMVIEPPVKFLE